MTMKVVKRGSAPDLGDAEAPAITTAALSRARRATLSVGTISAVPLALLGLWSAAALIAGPGAVATPGDALSEIARGVEEGRLLPALGVTLTVALWSFIIASVLGLTLGVVLGISRFWGDVFEAPVYWVYSIPKITLYPIFLLLFGLTASARVSFAVFHGFIPLLIYVFTAIRSINPVYIKTAKVYRMGRMTMFRSIILPDSLPSVVVGLRYCFSLSFLGVIVAEMFASTEGTGQLLILAMGRHRVDEVFAIAFVLVLIALLVNGFFLWVESRMAGTRTTSTRSGGT